MFFYKTFSIPHGTTKFQTGDYKLTPLIFKYIKKCHSRAERSSTSEISSGKTKTPNLYSAQQIHGSRISIVKKSQLYYPDCDGLITDQKNLILTIRHADCVPILIYDAKKEVLALVHSGWKGTRDEIGLKALQIMTKHYGTNPQDCLVRLLPSAKKCCYRFVTHWPHMALTHDNKWQKYIEKKRLYYYLDMQGYIRNMFSQAGVEPGSISISSVCTICNPRYYSWTRQKEYRSVCQNNLSIAYIS